MRHKMIQSATMSKKNQPIRISEHIHEHLRKIKDETGIPIKRLADRMLAEGIARHDAAVSRSTGGAGYVVETAQE